MGDPCEVEGFLRGGALALAGDDKGHADGVLAGVVVTRHRRVGHVLRNRERQRRRRDSRKSGRAEILVEVAGQGLAERLAPSNPTTYDCSRDGSVRHGPQQQPHMAHLAEFVEPDWYGFDIRHGHAAANCLEVVVSEPALFGVEVDRIGHANRVCHPRGAAGGYPIAGARISLYRLRCVEGRFSMTGWRKVGFGVFGSAVVLLASCGGDDSVTADADSDITVSVGSAPMFDGCESDGEIVNYSWVIVEAPPAMADDVGKSIRETSGDCSFELESAMLLADVGTWLVELTVADDSGDSSADTVRVDVSEQPGS